MPAEAEACPPVMPASAKRRYFFEITDTADFVRLSSTPVGITRVTLAIIKALAEQLGPDLVFMCAKDRKSGEFICMDTYRLVQVSDFDSASMRYALGMTDSPELDSPPTLEKYENQPFKSAFHKLSRRYRAWRSDDAFFRRRGSTLKEWTAYRSKESDIQVRGSATRVLPPPAKVPVLKVAKPGDELCLPGAQWERTDLHRVFEDLSHRGINISLIVYDLIAINRPDLSMPDLPPRFLDWLECAVGYTSRYLAISQYTGEEIKCFLADRGLSKPTAVVPLAFEMPAPDVKIEGPNEVQSRTRVTEYARVRREIHAATSRRFVLCVGTMEVRKNNLGLAQAWERLSRDESVDLPQLVFAGKRGWNNDAFFNWMKASGALGGWVHLIENPTDEELKFMYRRCEFTAMVSFAEGWGLPIGESLSYGKTAVVADNSAMPEVGGNLVEYCDAHSVKSIANACRRLIDGSDRRKELEARIQAAELRTWDDVLKDFVAALDCQIELAPRD